MQVMQQLSPLSPVWQMYLIEEGSSVSSINLTMGWKWDVGCVCVKFLLPPEGARGGLEGHLMKCLSSPLDGVQRRCRLDAPIAFWVCDWRETPDSSLNRFTQVEPS